MPSNNKYVLTLNEQDILELHAVLIDEDKDAALAFLQSRVAPQLPRKGNAPCDSSRLDPFLMRPDSGRR